MEQRNRLKEVTISPFPFGSRLSHFLFSSFVSLTPSFCCYTDGRGDSETSVNIPYDVILATTPPSPWRCASDTDPSPAPSLNTNHTSLSPASRSHAAPHTYLDIHQLSKRTAFKVLQSSLGKHTRCTYCYCDGKKSTFQLSLASFTECYLCFFVSLTLYKNKMTFKAEKVRQTECYNSKLMFQCSKLGES